MQHADARFRPTCSNNPLGSRAYARLLGVQICAFTMLLLAAGVAAAVQVTAPASGDWLLQAQVGLAIREYNATASPRGLQAPNRAQGFRAYFDERELRLVARDDDRQLIAAVSVLAQGRQHAMQPPGIAEVRVEASDLTMTWSMLSARFDNSEHGLAAAWTLSQRPEGKGLRLLDLAIGDAAAALHDGGVLLQGAAGALRLGDFAASDARGHRMTLTPTTYGDRVRLAVDDRDASYPITIKLLVTAVADAILEAHQANARLGVSVAAAGDVNGDGYTDVLVGAPDYDSGQVNEGAAFLYLGGAGVFDLVADAQLEADQANAQMGASVASAGDLNGDGYADVVVGAPRYDIDQPDEGAAFVYFGAVGAFNPQADGLLQSNQANAHFAASVDGVGDVNGDGYADLIVGADSYSSGESQEGAATIYFGGVGNAFEPNADGLIESNQANAHLGAAVSAAGDVNGDGYADLLVGAPGYDLGQTDEGVAFVYFGGAGPFNAVVDALLEMNQPNANLGASVAGVGDVNGDGYADIGVGAPNYDNQQNDEGAAFLYFGGAGAFDAAPDAQLEANEAQAHAGASLADADDVNGDGYADVIVGIPGYDNDLLDQGAAFVYFGGPGAFNTMADARLESGGIGALAGSSVASAGDVNGDGYGEVVVGAPGYDNGQNDQGAALIYMGSAAAFDAAADAQLEMQQTASQFGARLAGAGDVNGDGYSDWIVGAAAFDNGQMNAGAAFIYFGGAGTPDASADAQLQSNQAFTYLGASVAGAGDVNGDGYADVLVGAPYFDHGQADEGAVFIYFGNAGTFEPSADVQLEVNQADASFGFAVAGAGDVNGDGYTDVIVGAPNYDLVLGGEGAAFLYFGSAQRFDLVADAQLDGSQAGSALGYSVAGAGDVNADGLGDVVVGAPFGGLGGLIRIFHGGVGVFDTDWDQGLTLLQSGAELGFSVAGAGDVNGDGRDDVIAGAPYFDNGESDEGGAFVAYGNSLSTSDLELNQADASLGYAVSGAGDVNGDGYADVIVGAPNYDHGQTDEGAAFVYLGGDGLMNTVADAQLESDQVGARLGYSLAVAGDLNSDGYADVIVGAPNYDQGQIDEGAAMIYLGNQPGRLVQAMQYRADGSAPVASWGLSQQSNGFWVALQGSSPRGRERAKLLVEACSPGVRFGSVFCNRYLSADWTDLGSGPAGATLALDTSGLGVGNAYRWRARVQYAPVHVTAPGINASAQPSAGPWRRLQSHASGVDIRIGRSDTLLADGFER